MAMSFMSSSPQYILRDKKSAKATPDDPSHAKKSIFQWNRSAKCDAPSEKNQGSASSLDGASSPDVSSEIMAGTRKPSSNPGENPRLQTQTSLTESRDAVERKLTLNELKSILKRSRCMSETGDVTSDSDCTAMSTTSEFWSAFRSVDEVYSFEAKRVSFSEKIMRNTYRPGTCILQQKQKAQRKREKRQNKDRRRTASESDAADLANLTNMLSELRSSPNNDSDSGLEMEGTHCLEGVAEAEEEEVFHEVPSTSKKKRKNKARKTNIKPTETLSTC